MQIRIRTGNQVCQWRAAIIPINLASAIVPQLEDFVTEIHTFSRARSLKAINPCERRTGSKDLPSPTSIMTNIISLVRLNVVISSDLPPSLCFGRYSRIRPSILLQRDEQECDRLSTFEKLIENEALDI